MSLYVHLAALNSRLFGLYALGEASLKQLLCYPPEQELPNISVGQNLTGEFFSRVKIGSNTSLGDNVNILAHGGVGIGSNVRIHNNVQILTVWHPIHPDQRYLLKVAPVLIEDDVVIGEGALIVNSKNDGTPLIIRKGTRILPHSVVVKDTLENCIYGGSPARVIPPADALQDSFSRSSDLNFLPDHLKIEDQSVIVSQTGHNARIILPVFIKNPQNLQSTGYFFCNRGTVFTLDGICTVGQGTLFAPSCLIEVKKDGKLEIGEKVWLGAGAEIQVSAGQSIKIGNGSVLAAGSSVSSDVPAMSVVVGQGEIKKQITSADMVSGIVSEWDNSSYIDKSNDNIPRLIKQALSETGNSAADIVQAIMHHSLLMRQKRALSLSAGENFFNPRQG